MICGHTGSYTVSKNVNTLSHGNADKRESILTIFGVNITEKVSNQKILYFPTSAN